MTKFRWTKLYHNLVTYKEMSVDEAIQAIQDMINRVDQGEDPELILEDYELEPDYVMDLLAYCEAQTIAKQ